jgi:hypothetical protein
VLHLFSSLDFATESAYYHENLIVNHINKLQTLFDANLLNYVS